MILGVDGWSAHDEDADHLVHRVREMVASRLGTATADLAVLATHEVRSAPAHSAVSCLLPGSASAGPGLAAEVAGIVESVAGLLPVDGAVVATSSGLADGLCHGQDAGALAGAWSALAAAATGTSGRLVQFAGAADLVGRLSVADLLAGSAVEEVVVVGGAVPTPGAVVDTLGFVRPRLEQGRVRLLVQPAAGGVLVPFERADPHRCCEDR